MRLAILCAVTVALAAPASAQNQPEAGIPGGIGLTQSEVVHSYGLTASRDTPAEALARLNRWCESERRADQRRCEAAWKRINAIHARMQSARAD